MTRFPWRELQGNPRNTFKKERKFHPKAPKWSHLGRAVQELGDSLEELGAGASHLDTGDKSWGHPTQGSPACFLPDWRKRSDFSLWRHRVPACRKAPAA